MDIFSTFAVNTQAEAEGTWIEAADGASFRVARKGNSAYRKLLSKLYKQHRALLEGKSDAAETKSDEILATVISKTILVDWKGVTAKGKPLPYSQETAYEMLLAHKEFREYIDGLASELEHFKAANDAGDEKN